MFFSDLTLCTEKYKENSYQKWLYLHEDFVSVKSYLVSAMFD